MSSGIFASTSGKAIAILSIWPVFASIVRMPAAKPR